MYQWAFVYLVLTHIYNVVFYVFSLRDTCWNVIFIKDVGHNEMTIYFFVESHVRIRNWFDLWWQFADIRWNKKCLRFNCINFQPSLTFIRKRTLFCWLYSALYNFLYSQNVCSLQDKERRGKWKIRDKIVS